MNAALQERNLTGFDWLSLSKWSVDTILTQTERLGKKNCKVCSEWVARNEQEKHVKFHVKQRIHLAERDKLRREAERALEKLEAQKERKIIAEANPVSKFYDAKCVVCNKGILRTGRRGRPPIKHLECK